jgi:4-diphosphocytidyl-2-C-methyl-D-erythritol kinase
MKHEILSLRTPSKINLFLKVTGKRNDGYHNLETVFLPLSNIFDTIKLKIAEQEGIKIISSPEDIPCNKSNLCYKAAEQYALKTRISPKWEIHIDKQIPVSAGMGGGSSDAAAVLLLLQNLYNSPMKKKELSFLAVKIGADVPFFLDPVPSTGYGIGDILKPIEVNCNFYILICASQFPVTAAWAYKNMVKPGICEKFNIDELISSLMSGDINTVLKFVKNDLAPALYNKFPILSILRDDLISFGAKTAEITGSGPTLFSICKDKSDADKIAVKMVKKYGSALKLAISPILN